MSVPHTRFSITSSDSEDTTPGNASMRPPQRAEETLQRVVSNFSTHCQLDEMPLNPRSQAQQTVADSCVAAVAPRTTALPRKAIARPSLFASDSDSDSDDGLEKRKRVSRRRPRRDMMQSALARRKEEDEELSLLKKQRRLDRESTLELLNSKPPRVSDAWELKHDSSAIVTHAFPHVVVSQVLCPDIAAFLPLSSVDFDTTDDSRLAVSVLRLKFCIPGVFEHAAQFPYVTHMSGFHLLDREPKFVGISKIVGLHSITLVACDAVDVTFFAEVVTLPALQDLCVSSCPNVNATCLEQLALASAHLRLRTFDVSDCIGVDAQGLGHLVPLTHLWRLSIAGCRAIDRGAVEQILKIARLSELDIRRCPNVSDDLPAHSALRIHC